MNSDLLKELKLKTRRISLRNRFSSTSINSPEYLELNNLDSIDIERNSENAINDFNYLPPPPPIMNELPEEIAEDYNNDIDNLKKSINKKLCCLGFSLISLFCGLGVIYKYYID